MSIEILLATYNGAAYLSDQLDSLLAQTCRAFTILARDDCSTDGTVQILADYAARHSGRIRVLPSPPRQVGASANFAALVDAADAEYIFFSDQDDVWLPDKMAVSLAAMERMIGSHGASSPLLVHTDLIVADAELRTLGCSLHRYAGFAPERNRLGELLLGNVVTGCTIMANRPLYSLARPISHAVLMYDHWFAQVAAAMGAIAFVDHPTILYRQHQTNVVGVRRAGIPRFLSSLRRTLLSDATLRVLASYSDHAGVLLARFGERVDPLERQQLEALTHIWAVPRMRRYAALRQTGLGKSRFVGNVALFLLLLRDRPRVAGVPR